MADEQLHDVVEPGAGREQKPETQDHRVRRERAGSGFGKREQCLDPALNVVVEVRKTGRARQYRR